MLRALSLAIGQLPDPAFRAVLWRSVGLSLLVFIAIGAGAWFGLSRVPRFETEWLNAVVALVSGLGLLFVMALVFPAVATAMVGLFLDDIAAAVEARHYPADPPGRPLPFVTALVTGLRFLALVIGLNLLILPLYLLFIWLPPINLVIFYVLNGYLLSREYFELAAGRHAERAVQHRLWRRHRGRLVADGVLVALGLTVPIVNLLMPLVATAAMVHEFKALQAADRAAGPR